jgi:hypothetical protein
MKKNLEVDIPKHASAEISREHTLRSSTFTKTRIATLCLILVLALSIGGTLAYLAWTANQTPNRSTNGDIEIEIVETNKKDGASTEVDSSKNITGTAEGGEESKQVTVKSDDDANRAEEVARVYFIPEIESNDMEGANVAIAEYWGKGVQQDATTNKYYIETDVIKLWLADDWSTNWAYDNGTFYYKKVLPKDTKTTTLLTGVTLQDSVSKSDYKSIKVNVVAEALQITPKEALDDWKVEITGTGDSRVVSKKTS